MQRNDRILAVDDNEASLAVLEEILADEYELLCARSGEEAQRMAVRFRPNLVLLDIMMPGVDGHAVCRWLRQQPELRDSKVIMLSAKDGVKERLAAYDEGAVDYIIKPFHDREVVAKVRAWMRMIHRDQVEDIWREADEARSAVGAALVKLTGLRDVETGEHLFRMRWYSVALAEQLGAEGPYRDQIDEEFLENLYRASPLHDIGKVAIADAILRKPGRLTDDEFSVMQRHTVYGSDILQWAVHELADAGYVRMAAEIARHHHERFDGTGYPDGLCGPEIPLAARIVAVADAFDALTSHRVYREPVTLAEAAQEIERNAGGQFDPAIVAAFRDRIDEFQQAQARFADGYLASRAAGALDLEERFSEVDHVEHERDVRLAVGRDGLRG
jgi:putative two-component system response regulator